MSGLYSNQARARTLGETLTRFAIKNKEITYEVVNKIAVNLIGVILKPTTLKHSADSNQLIYLIIK